MLSDDELTSLGLREEEGGPSVTHGVAYKIPDDQVQKGRSMHSERQKGLKNVLWSTGLVYCTYEFLSIRPWITVLDELDFREKGGYTRAVVEVHHSGTGEVVKALLYTGNARNPNFHALPHDIVAHVIAWASGPSGLNVEYFLNGTQRRVPHRLR